MNTRPHIAAFAARSIFLACALLSLLAILALPVFAQTDGTLEPLEALKTSEIIPFQESQNGFAVAWIEVPYAAEYKLEVKKTSEGEEAWVRVTKGDFGPLPGGLSSYSLTGVATGLECNKAYDVRLGIRGDGESYSNVWVSTTKPNFATTTECAKGNRITNLRRTVEPGVVTLIWTAPTDDKFTGIKVDRINRVDDEAQGAQPPAQDPLTTLYESNNDSRTRYEDRTVVEGYKNAYIVTPIERLDPPIQHTDGTTEEYRAVDLGRAFTGEAPLRPTSTPVYPRNVRFTQESRSSRRLAWETPADRHLTIEKIYRGETSRPVNDPWLTGYQVERREYILHEAERSDEVTTVLPESVEERLLTATMTVAVAGFTRGFDASSFPHMGALTQTTVSHRSRPGGYTVDELFYNTAGTPTFCATAPESRAARGRVRRLDAEAHQYLASVFRCDALPHQHGPLIFVAIPRELGRWGGDPCQDRGEAGPGLGNAARRGQQHHHYFHRQRRRRGQALRVPGAGGERARLLRGKRQQQLGLGGPAPP